MALQSSGQITFGNISNEFGLPPGKNLGAYRVSESHGSLSNLPLDNTIPQSGEIRFSDFYSRRLNVVVDCHSGGTETRANARSKYNASQVNVVGGFRGQPSPPSGIKVIINVNKSFQSQKDNNQNIVALRTGEYGSNCLLRVDVGGSGYIGGAGGNGGSNSGGPGAGGEGNGGEGSESQGGSAGGNGAAIRRESGGITISVVNNGTIRGSTSATGVA